MSLFHQHTSSKGGAGGEGSEQDSSVAKLLRERSSIAASMKSINDVIRYRYRHPPLHPTDSLSVGAARPSRPRAR
jgi:hypothetical protein